MDFSRFGRAHWLMLGGTLAVLLGTLLLDWWSVDLGPIGDIGGSAWDTGTLGKLAVLAALLMLGGAILLLMDRADIPLTALVPIAMLVLGAFVALMALIKVVDRPDGVDPALGLWLSLIGGLVAAYGGYEAGGVAGINAVRATRRT